MTPRRPHPRPSTLAATALAAAGLLALGGCGDETVAQAALDQSVSPATSTAPAAPAESSTTPAAHSVEPTPAESAPADSAPAESAPAESAPADPAPADPEPRMIAYAGGESPGAEIHNRADADKLDRAPASFKRFIGRAAERLAAGSTCADGYVGITVEFLRTDGYAVGGVNECGGYRALWAVVDGSWKEVAASQEMWDCAVLERYTVPSEVAGTRCYDYDAQKERDYAAS